jgi:hypothetical protein
MVHPARRVGAPRQVDGGRGDGGMARGDEPFLPVETLHLPRAEAEENEKGASGKDGRPDDRSVERQHDGHCFYQREVPRPSARCRYCSAIKPALKRRNMTMLPTRTKGVQSKR